MNRLRAMPLLYEKNIRVTTNQEWVKEREGGGVGKSGALGRATHESEGGG